MGNEYLADNVDHPLISVIVPIYNVDQYLPRCVDSIRAQTLKDIQIILIDDESTDNSGLLCDKWAQEDDRIDVIHIDHGGQALARNIGIKNANAKYLMFVDADDYVEPEFCELPYRAAMEHNVEMVCFKKVWKEKKDTNKEPLYDIEGVIPEEKKLDYIVKGITISPCDKLYSSRLFEEISFPEGVIYEDLAVIHKLLYASEGIYLMNKYLYYYCYREESTMHTISSKGLCDFYSACEQRANDLKAWGAECDCEIFINALSVLVRYGRKTMISDKMDAVIRSFDECPQGVSRKRCIAYKIYCYSPFLFDVLCVLSGRRIKLRK